MEAQASRGPLLLLSADRPAHLQQVEAPQTADQVKLFGQHVRKFVQMPHPSSDQATLRYVRQMAFDACVAAYGAMPGARSCDGGPVHVNFPFDEPLMPTLAAPSPAIRTLPPTVVPGQVMRERDAQGLLGLLRGRNVVALCGEGTCNDADEARDIIEFSHVANVPLLADPLSGLRSFDDEMVIDAYDTALGRKDVPIPDVIVRFGRWPVSKRAYQKFADEADVQIVVDLRDARDYSCSTSILVRTTPVAFARGMTEAIYSQEAVLAYVNEVQDEYELHEDAPVVEPVRTSPAAALAAAMSRAEAVLFVPDETDDAEAGKAHEDDAFAVGSEGDPPVTSAGTDADALGYALGASGGGAPGFDAGEGGGFATGAPADPALGIGFDANVGEARELAVGAGVSEERGFATGADADGLEPGAGAGEAVVLRSFADRTVNSVELLGFGPVPFRQEFGLLVVSLPEKLPSLCANALKIR